MSALPVRFFPRIRVQYASDIHLQHLGDRTPFGPILKPVAPVLALAGNIGVPGSRMYRDFLFYCSRSWDRVFVVPGSLESSPSTSIVAVASEFPNVSILDRRRVMVDGVAFVGCTFWPGASGDRVWLKEELRTCEEAAWPTVVVTHFPHVWWRHGPAMRVWISGNTRYGRTHYETHGTLYCTNPRGWLGALNEGYCRELFADISTAPVRLDTRDAEVLVASQPLF